jgi:hypothetical protein
MGQVNVNAPGPAEPVGEPPGSGATGMIVGILLALIVLAAIIYFVFIAPGSTAPPADGGGGATPGASALLNGLRTLS